MIFILQASRLIGATFGVYIIRRGFLTLLVKLRWAMSEPLYVGRVTEDSHAFLFNKLPH